MSAIDSNNSFKPASKKKRFGVVLVGLLGNKIVVDLFDKALYPWVIWNSGSICGGVIMIFASLLICLLTFEFYDWAKQDWLGIETMKEAKDAEHKSRVLRWAMRQSDSVLFVVLSLWTDPFITTVAMRKGAWQFNGLSRRDWKIFFGSLVIGNLEWIVLVSGGIIFIRKIVWPWIQTLI